MTLETIAPGVHRILKGYVNVYLIEADDGLTIVDCGMPKKAEKLMAAVREAGRSPDDVRTVLITHHHSDHVGSLAALVRATGAIVYVPALDAPIVRGERPAPPANKAVITGRLLGPLLARLEPSVEPARIDVEVADRDSLPVAGEVTAIHTPGHTEGHTSFLLPRGGGVLFVGDAAGAKGSRAAPPVGLIFGMFTEDLDEARRSFRKLAGTAVRNGGVRPREAAASGRARRVSTRVGEPLSKAHHPSRLSSAAGSSGSTQNSRSRPRSSNLNRPTRRTGTASPVEDLSRTVTTVWTSRSLPSIDSSSEAPGTNRSSTFIPTAMTSPIPWYVPASGPEPPR